MKKRTKAERLRATLPRRSWRKRVYQSRVPPWHFSNMVLHVLCIFLVYRLGKRLIGSEVGAGVAEDTQSIPA